MDKYIQEVLEAGIIHSSSSTATAGFFLVKRKDKMLWACIDYHGQNNITLKNCYPLPLISH